MGYLRVGLVGRIAQVVEQLTLNQRVQGSSPCAPTNVSNGFLNICAKASLAGKVSGKVTPGTGLARKSAVPERPN